MQVPIFVNVWKEGSHDRVEHFKVSHSKHFMFSKKIGDFDASAFADPVALFNTISEVVSEMPCVRTWIEKRSCVAQKMSPACSPSTARSEVLCHCRSTPSPARGPIYLDTLPIRRRYLGTQWTGD